MVLRHESPHGCKNTFLCSVRLSHHTTIGLGLHSPVRALPQAHGLAIVRSLPPDHDSGTVCQQMSVGPTSQPKLSAEVEDVFVWSRCQHLVTVVFRRCV